MALLSSRFATLARTARPVLVIVLCIALVILVVLGLRIQSALTGLRSEATDNLYWNLSQLEVDLVRLSEEIRVRAGDPATPLDELRKRHDLFYSRAQNVIQGQGFGTAGLEHMTKSLGAMLSAYLAEETPLIDGPDDALRQSLPVMADRLARLREDLRKASIQLIEGLAKQSGDRRAALTLLVNQLALATLTTIGLLGCLLALIILLNRAAIREARHTARVSRQLKATVDSALDAIIAADSQGRIIQFNASAESTFGYAREEVMGRDLGSLILPEGEHAAGLLGLQGSGRFQTRALSKSGREFPVELSLSSADGDEGMIFIAFLRDISDRLAAEAGLTRARDEALAAERTKSEFLAVMSHEIRTPLNGVIASLEIAGRTDSNPEQARFIALARESAQQLLRHANDLLDITRMESGGMRLSGEDFDLESHLTGLVDGVRPICAERGIDLRFNMLTPSARLNGDPFRLGQIVQNFLSNAIKFVEVGGITVEAEVTGLGEDLREVEVRVIDTGPGIAAEDQERVFQDFVMLDPSFRRSAGGVGLGLAISRRLASAMGGEVGLESESGAGSCFWLRLPLSPARELTVRPVPDKTALRPPAMDILVVEDNATNRAVMENMLRQLGQRVVMAVDGEKGAAEAAARRYDLILMDISMPVMDGLAATQLIRSTGASRNARIVAVTAHSMPEDLARFRATGMDDVLVKPISSAGLLQVLPQPATGLLDADRIADLTEAVGGEAFGRLLQTFLQDGRTLKDRIQHAARQEGGAEDLEALCHEAAGVAAVFGAQALHLHYATAERELRGGDAAVARERLLLDTESLWRETEVALAVVSEERGASLGQAADSGRP